MVLLNLPLLIFLACTTTSSKNEADATAKRPNIIYILADDLGYGDLSCYGQQQLFTPHIDQLASEGIRFTQHYAGSTVCAPSRASLLTGMHAGHINVRGNQPPGQLIRNETTTIPEALKPAGYTSAIIGKWGVGHPPEPNDPHRNGFDHHYGYINMWHAHNFYPEFLYRNSTRETLAGNKTDWNFDYEKYHPKGMPEGTGVASAKETYVLTEFEKDAHRFIEQNQENPFFLYLALNMPHANNEAGHFLGDGMEVPMMDQDGKIVSNYGDFVGQEWPNPEKGFAQMMKLIDDFVGGISQKLEELNLDENTVLIFSSDNGPHQEGGHKVDFFDSNGPLRGSKRDLYEGGIRVPLIARWKEQIKPGSVSDHSCGFFDLLPTLCEIAGIDPPDNIDGISFLPTLLGQPKQSQHNYLYWEFYEQGGKQAVLQDQWKLVRLNIRDATQPIRTELYDLSKDLGETQNLADTYPGRVADMSILMDSAHVASTVISLFETD